MFYGLGYVFITSDIAINTNSIIQYFSYANTYLNGNKINCTACNYKKV